MNGAGGEGRRIQSLSGMDTGELKIERRATKGCGENGDRLKVTFVLFRSCRWSCCCDVGETLFFVFFCQSQI